MRRGVEYLAERTRRGVGYLAGRTRRAVCSLFFGFVVPLINFYYLTGFTFQSFLFLLFYPVNRCVEGMANCFFRAVLSTGLGMFRFAKKLTSKVTA